MKKLLSLILIALLLALSIFIVLQGFSIGNLEVLSYKGIQQRSMELDEKIQEASKLAEKDYKQAVSNVNESSKKLEKVKNQYIEMTTVSTEGEIQQANQLQKYEVETLWVKLGNYATSEGAVLRMDIVNGTTAAKDTYNLKFTVNGSYISITDFISDIENDTALGFRIEEFKLVPSGDTLQATFVCKDIVIEQVTQISNENIGKTEDGNNTNNTNGTNTNNTSTNGNTTNTNSTNTNNTVTNENATNTNTTEANTTNTAQ